MDQTLAYKRPIADRQDGDERKSGDRRNDDGDQEIEGLAARQTRHAAQPEPSRPSQNLQIPEGADLVAEKGTRRREAEQRHGVGLARHGSEPRRSGARRDGDHSAATGATSDTDRKSGGAGTRVAARLELGGRRA